MISNSPIYSSLYLSYTVTTQSRCPSVSFYTSDPIYGSTNNPRFRLLPDPLNGQLTSYNTKQGSLIMTHVTSFIVKVSDDVTNMTLKIGFIPGQVLTPCPNTTVYACYPTVVDCCHCNKKCEARTCIGREPAITYPLEENPGPEGPQIIVIPLGRFVEIRQLLRETIEETSTGTLLPLIPPRLRLLQEPTELTFNSGVGIECNLLVGEASTVYNPAVMDPQWRYNVIEPVALMTTVGIDPVCDIDTGLQGYYTGEDTNLYRTIECNVTLLDVVVVTLSFELHISFYLRLADGGWRPYPISIPGECDTTRLDILLGQVTESTPSITFTCTAILPRDARVISPAINTYRPDIPSGGRYRTATIASTVTLTGPCTI